MKKYLYISAVLMTMFVSITKTNSNLQNNISLGTFMANVEALASNDETGKQPMNCYSYVETKDDGKPVETQTYCGDCQPIRCTHWSNLGRCMR